MQRAHPDHSIISSERVQGTDVYSTGGDKIGAVDHMMIEKKSGRVVYAIIGFGGFLGMGESHHPVPWGALKYDTNLDGYVTGITADQLRDAPEFSDNAWESRDWENRVHNHYGVTPYYM